MVNDVVPTAAPARAVTTATLPRVPGRVSRGARYTPRSIRVGAPTSTSSDSSARLASVRFPAESRMLATTAPSAPAPAAPPGFS